jgi:hypothetical protein
VTIEFSHPTGAPNGLENLATPEHPGFIQAIEDVGWVQKTCLVSVGIEDLCGKAGPAFLPLPGL